MKMQARNTGGEPSIIFVPETDDECQLFDKYLGDCGAGPITLVGYIKLADQVGELYMNVWNPAMAPKHKTPKE